MKYSLMTLLLLTLNFHVLKAQNNGLPTASENDSIALVFHTIINYVYSGDFEKIPDDQLFRSYLVSVYHGLSNTCSPKRKNIDLVVAKYGFRQIRDLQNDLNNNHKLIGALLGYSKEGVSIDKTNYSKIYPYFYEPGVEDGKAIAKYYNCNFIAVRILEIRLMELFETRQNVQPQSNDVTRWKNLMDSQWQLLLGNNPPIISGETMLSRDRISLLASIKNHKPISTHQVTVNSYEVMTDFKIRQGDIIEMKVATPTKVGELAKHTSPKGIAGYVSFNQVEGFRYGALLYKIGNGKWRQLGYDVLIRAEESGNIQFLINDAKPKNNRAAFKVNVTHYQF